MGSSKTTESADFRDQNPLASVISVHQNPLASVVSLMSNPLVQWRTHPLKYHWISTPVGYSVDPHILHWMRTRARTRARTRGIVHARECSWARVRDYVAPHALKPRYEAPSRVSQVSTYASHEHTRARGSEYACACEAGRRHKAEHVCAYASHEQTPADIKIRARAACRRHPHVRSAACTCVSSWAQKRAQWKPNAGEFEANEVLAEAQNRSQIPNDSSQNTARNSSEEGRSQAIGSRLQQIEADPCDLIWCSWLLGSAVICSIPAAYSAAQWQLRSCLCCRYQHQNEYQRRPRRNEVSTLSRS